VVCIPTLQDLQAETDLLGAQVVLTGSRAVNEAAGAIEPHALCIQLPKWEPIASLNDWLGLTGRFVATEEEKAGNLQEWLMEVVGEMAGAIGMDQTFESDGLDYLALISLARRLTAKVGKTVSVVDLYDHPTPQQLLNALSGGPQRHIVRSKVVALHGYRTNRDIMNLRCGPYVSAVGTVDWIFINAPRAARGAPEPEIPEDMECFEWYGQDGGHHSRGWLAEYSDGLEETLPAVTALSPLGIVGFSQGGAVAALVDCPWVALFSAMIPPGMKARSTPSWHTWDKNEAWVAQCIEVADHFSNKEVHFHSEDHNVPQSEDIVQAFAEWVAKQSSR